MIRVLIAEDSPTIQRVLVSLLEQEPDIEVVGVANDGVEALAMCRRYRPDLVTMDIFMPNMGGLDATRAIMRECPTRIVVLSSMVGERDSHFSFAAMRAGAIDVLPKPTDILSGGYDAVRQRIVSLVRESVHARPDAQLSWLPTDPTSAPSPQLPSPERRDDVARTRCRPLVPRERPMRPPHLVAIGGSTGAPTVIVEILSRLPGDYPVPVVVGQHIAKGFAARMAQWLDASVPLRVAVAREAGKLVAGEVVVCPDDRYFSCVGRGRYQLYPVPENHGHVPHIDRLFTTVAEHYGSDAVGILLSGMGNDGAEGMVAMTRAGAYTVAQNEDTSVVFGMNKVACERGGIQELLAPDEIAAFLLSLV